MSIKKIALIPDRFASYRVPIFQKLSASSLNKFKLIIFADVNEDIKGIQIADSSYANTDIESGGVIWKKVKTFTFKNICFWQSKVSFLPLREYFDAFVFWGEANRISTWFSCIIAKLLGRKVIFWSHGIYGNEKPIKLYIRTLFYKFADAFLLYSDYGKLQMIKNGFEENKLFVIKNSLNVDRQNFLYEQYKNSDRREGSRLFDSSSRVLLFLGRLEPKKKIHLLIKGLSKLRLKSNVDYKLLIIGEGSAEQSLKKLVTQLNLCSHVIFYGTCYDDNLLAPLFISSDLCVSPGNVGLLAMHSLIYGTPVITHDNFSLQMPEFEVIKPKISGDYFRFNDVDDMVKKIMDVMQLIDEELITDSSCRQEILGTYNTEYQQRIFNEMLNYLNNK